MRKLLSSIILAMILVNSCILANANEKCLISGSDINVNAGEAFSAVIELSNNSGLTALSLSVEYDSDFLKLSSVKNGEVFADDSLSTSSNSEENPYKANWVNVDLSDSFDNGNLITLNFDVAKDCETEATYLKLKIEQAFNSSLEDVEISTTDITVNIKGSNKRIKGISVTPPKKTEYLVNENVDLSGMTVKAIYSDGSTADVTQKADVNGFDSSKAGTKLVTVTYKDFSTAFPVQIKSSENSLYLKTEYVKAVAGESIEIPVEVLNNPGVCGVESKISFDSEVFSLDNVKNGNVFANNQMTLGGDKTKTPYTVFWENATATENNSKAGTLAVLNLKVNDDATVGGYPVGIKLSNAVDCNLNSVSALDYEMMINIFSRKYLFADASGDGLVNIRDATLIQKYLIGAEETIDLDASECEDDGVITILDATKIQRLVVNLATDDRFETYIYV